MLSIPSGSRMDLIVELHDRPGTEASHIIPNRFTKTHDIEMIGHSGRNLKLPPVLERLGHLDQLLSVWEWRAHHQLHWQ